MKESGESSKMNKRYTVILLFTVFAVLFSLLHDDWNWANFFRHLIRNIIRNIF